MDVIERLNRKFGAWYEGLFGASSDRDLRPRDILHRLISAMEDARREGLDGEVYVPNVYTLQIAVTDDDERDYLRTFLSAEDLSAAVQRAIDQHGYRVKGGLSFQIEEISSPAGITGAERVRIRPRFDTSVAEPVGPPLIPDKAPFTPSRSRVAPAAKPVEPDDDEDDDYEPGTVASLPTQVLASLVVRGADGHLREVYPIGPQETVIGRGKRAGNDIVLASDGMVSKRHAAILYDEGTGRFLVRDEGSTNGTTLNGVRLSPNQPRALEPGDQIGLGETTLIYRPTEEPSAERSAVAVPPRVSSTNAFRTPVEQPLMLVSREGESHLLASEMSVGRAFTSDLVLVGEGIASQHARLFRQSAPNSGGEERFYVEDFGTSGGTSVNGERIPARFPVALYENDEIVFGGVALRFVRRIAGTNGAR